LTKHSFLNHLHINILYNTDDKMTFAIPSGDDRKKSKPPEDGKRKPLPKPPSEGMLGFDTKLPLASSIRAPKEPDDGMGLEDTEPAIMVAVRRDDSLPLAAEGAKRIRIADMADTIKMAVIDGRLVPTQNGHLVDVAGMELVPKTRAESDVLLERAKNNDTSIKIIANICVAAIALFVVLQMRGTSMMRILEDEVSALRAKLKKEQPVTKTKAEIYEEATTDEEIGTDRYRITNFATRILAAKGMLGDSINLSQVLELYDWVRDNVKYITREEGQEPLKVTGWIDTENRAGDCKNMAAMLIALGRSIGARMALVTIECEELPTGECSGHAYAAVRVYKPTKAESEDVTLRVVAYDDARDKIERIILARYPTAIAEIEKRTISFIEGDTGLFLVLDPTLKVSAYAGKQIENATIKDFIEFGKDEPIGMR